MGRALGLSVGAVSKYWRAVRAAGVSPEEVEKLPETDLERRVFGRTPVSKPPRRRQAARARSRRPSRLLPSAPYGRYPHRSIGSPCPCSGAPSRSDCVW